MTFSADYRTPSKPLIHIPRTPPSHGPCAANSRTGWRRAPASAHNVCYLIAQSAAKSYSHRCDSSAGLFA
jgi:hypothetical protein